MIFQNLRQHDLGTSDGEAVPNVWRALVLLLTVVFVIALSFKRPWTMVLDDPQILRVDEVQVKAQSGVDALRTDHNVTLPDQWSKGSPMLTSKTYSFEFDRSAFSANSLAIFIPFARDNLILRVNGGEYGAFAYSSGRDRWLWNKPLLFRLADDVLVNGTNLVEFDVSSASAWRVAVSKVFIGPTEKLDGVFTVFRWLQLTLPLATFVLLVWSVLALLAYSFVGGAVYGYASFFCISAAVSLLSWVLVVPPLELHLWFVLISISQSVALASMAIFVCIYFGLTRWIKVSVFFIASSIIFFSVAALLAPELNQAIQFLKGSAVIWSIGGCYFLAMTGWCYVTSNNLEDRVMLMGTVLLIVYALRDSLVHLGLVSPSYGLHIPMGYAFFTLSMAFVFLRFALRHSRELEDCRRELSARVESQMGEIDVLTSKRKELELTAIAGRLSHIYSYEFRNPIGACLATGNLAIKQIDSVSDRLHTEVQKIVDSSMECSSLLAQMFASEEVLPPPESNPILRMPEWLSSNVDELSAAIGCRVLVEDCESINILIRPHVLLKAINLLFGDAYQNKKQLGHVAVRIDSIGVRGQIKFVFAQSLQPERVGHSRHWVECFSRSRELLSAVNADLIILYDTGGKMNAFIVDVSCVNTVSSTSQVAKG